MPPPRIASWFEAPYADYSGAQRRYDGGDEELILAISEVKCHVVASSLEY